MMVAGVDGWKREWVSVLLADGAVGGVAVFPTLADVVAALPEAEVIAVDVPIGLPEAGHRRADAEAKRLLGMRASTVFYAPPREVLAEPTYREANARSWERFGHGVSAQAYRLREKIGEAAVLAEADERLVEAHPELSFAVMAGGVLRSSKKSWNGQAERRALLHAAGVVLDRLLPGRAGDAPPDDVLDAAAAAWTARRVATGTARHIPDPPETIRGRAVAIRA